MMLVVTRRRRPPRGPAGSFRITLRDGGIGAAYLASEYLTWLFDMKNYFENIIVGPNVNLNVDVSFTNLGGTTLGTCGPGDGTWNPLSYLNDIDISGSFARPNRSTMKMSTQYFQVNPTTDSLRRWREQFFHIAVHECFHAVGMGSLWNGDFRILTATQVPLVNEWVVTRLNGPLSPFQNLNNVGAGNPNTARYTASRGLSAYQEQMVGRSGAANIPIENYGMGQYTTMADAGGTALAHWRVSSSPGGIQCYNRKNQSIDTEIMTGWSSTGMTGEYANEEWVSRFTIQCLRDIGWTVDNTPTEIPLHYWKSVF